MNRRATREGEVGQKTRRERRVVIEAALRTLHRDGLELRRLKNFRAKHLEAVLRAWRERGLLPSTLSTYISHLRVFCLWLDKPQHVQWIDDYLAANPQIARRTLVADRDHSLDGAGLSFEDVFGRARALDERYACTLLLMRVFCLRILEAMLLRPHLAQGPNGEIRIWWGTKGGRPRVLPIGMDEVQQRTLAWAKSFARHRADSMVPPEYTLQRWRRRVYYFNEKIGFTRTHGATPHSLRHGAACDLYELLAGVAAPVRGGTLPIDDPAADRAVRKVVAEHTGHARLQITAAYLGGLSRHPREDTSSTELLETTQPVDASSREPHLPSAGESAASQ